jgi:hypothetical protein
MSFDGLDGLGVVRVPLVSSVFLYDLPLPKFWWAQSKKVERTDQGVAQIPLVPMLQPPPVLLNSLRAPPGLSGLTKSVYYYGTKRHVFHASTYRTHLFTDGVMNSFCLQQGFCPLLPPTYKSLVAHLCSPDNSLRRPHLDLAALLGRLCIIRVGPETLRHTP